MEDYSVVKYTTRGRNILLMLLVGLIVCGDYWNARLTKLKIASDNRIKRGIVVQIELQTIWDDVQICVEMQYELHQYQWPLVVRFASGIKTWTCAVIFERRFNTRLCCNVGKLIGQFGVNRDFVAGNNSLHYRSGPLNQTRRRLLSVSGGQ